MSRFNTVFLFLAVIMILDVSTGALLDVPTIGGQGCLMIAFVVAWMLEGEKK